MSKRLVSPFAQSICTLCQRRSFARSFHNTRKRNSNESSPDENVGFETDAGERIRQLGGRASLPSYYPRLAQSSNELAMSAAHFSGPYKREAEQRARDRSVKEPLIKVYGRITAIHQLGTKLSFISLYTPGDHSSRSEKAQAMLGLGQIRKESVSTTRQEFRKFHQSIQRGDWIAVKGHAGTNKSGQWSIIATEIPQILSPSLKTVPVLLEDVAVRMHNRHMEHIVNPSSLEVLFLRHKIISSLRQFFVDRHFTEVSTPLLLANAGGASARPFTTRSTELPEVKISLRIATELFLKRLIVGGMQKIFEIGPIFRNEGVDHSHNPEFTMCEFYATMTSLKDLMAITEDLFRYLANATAEARAESEVPPLGVDFEQPFDVVDFIPGLEKQIRNRIPSWSFPDLADPEAAQHLAEAAKAFQISVPPASTKARLLDALSSHLLESPSEQPRFIIHHPECTSPLSKSFDLLHDGITHRVSARAELFINGSEYVNLYEEENSPVEQRRKFEAQLDDSIDEGHRAIDENYLKTMEWGLPPTGGWGAGVDRIVMLFSGKKRIADVLTFGTLRNVLGLASNAKSGEKPPERNASE